MRRYVYFAQSESTGIVKIGISQNPTQRVKGVSFGDVGDFRLLGGLPGDWHRERRLHEHFAGSRIEGEFFRPTRQVLSFAAVHARPIPETPPGPRPHFESYLTPDDVAEILGIPQPEVKALMKRNAIPHYRISTRTVRFRRDDVDRWVAENAETVAGE